MTRFTPRQPDPYILYQGDQEIAKFGHLNHLLKLINNISGSLPDMTGHAGEFLTTDGVTASWIPISGGTQDIEQTLTIGNDANQLDLINLANLTVDHITDVSGTGLLINDTGGGGAGITVNSLAVLALISSTSIVMTAGSLLDVTATNSVNVPIGTALNPAIIFGDPIDGVGLYRVSSVQGGATIGNTLTWGWNATGLFTGQITEQVIAAGILFSGTGDFVFPSGRINSSAWFTNNIQDAGGADMLISQTGTGFGITVQTADSDISLLSGKAIVLTAEINRNITLTTSGTGVINMNGAATYTGTLAGAAGLNVVNGLIIA